jgi:hypothetical protein
MLRRVESDRGAGGHAALLLAGDATNVQALTCFSHAMVSPSGFLPAFEHDSNRRGADGISGTDITPGKNVAGTTHRTLIL